MLQVSLLVILLLPSHLYAKKIQIVFMVMMKTNLEVSLTVHSTSEQRVMMKLQSPEGNSRH